MTPTDPKIQPQSKDASCTVTILHLIIEKIKYSRRNNATSITTLINKQPRLSYYRPPPVRHIFRTSCFRSDFLKLSCMEKPLSNLPYSEELLPMGMKTQSQEEFGNARILLQYCNLLGGKPRDTSTVVLKFWAYFKIFIHLLQHF